MSLSVIMYGAVDHEEDEVDGPFFVCSVSSWGEFLRWVGDLPDTSGQLPQLMSLASDGEATDTEGLRYQLRQAAEAYPPESGVLGTIDTLLEVIGEGEETETLTVIQE